MKKQEYQKPEIQAVDTDMDSYLMDTSIESNAGLTKGSGSSGPARSRDYNDWDEYNDWDDWDE